MKASLILLMSFFSLLAFSEPSRQISQTELKSRIKLLTQAPYSGGATLIYKGEEAGCAVFNLAYPVKDPYSDKILTYEMKFSWPHSDTPVPVILTVPTIEGITFIEDSILKQMCNMKVAAIIAHVNNENFKTGPGALELADHQLMRGAVALRSLMDVLENLPATENSSSISHVLIDSKRVGLVGLSIGSVSSLLATAVDPRFKGLFIMGAIGNTPYAMAYSDNSKVSKLRSYQMSELGISNSAQYEEYLRTQIKANPVDYAQLLSQRNVYQIIIENDSTAPTAGQYEIKRLTENKKVYFDNHTFGHSISLVGEMVISQKHLSNFVRTEIQ